MNIIIDALETFSIFFGFLNFSRTDKNPQSSDIATIQRSVSNKIDVHEENSTEIY